MLRGRLVSTPSTEKSFMIFYKVSMKYGCLWTPCGGPHWKNISFRFDVDTDGRVLQEKLSGGVRSDFWNLNSFCDQDVRFSLPYLTPDLQINTLFQTCFMISFLAFRTVAKSIAKGFCRRLECVNRTLFETKIAKIGTLFLTKTVNKSYPLGPHLPI